ncbi:HEPN domain-containing protein [Clostridium sp. BJN0001]|uniref:HEPN domain-containing protein n=1 Tax=Clostridium sp. BJN0001 TaxID=2930219 RepID=UPI001FD3D162|nr:HEPN domain-containing protein [Clostridium sp. BJN0001]
MGKFYIKNIELDKEQYKLNNYIVLRQSYENAKETMVQIDDSKNLYENNIVLFYRALEFSMPKVHIQAYADESDDVTYSFIKDLSCTMINYYSSKNNEYQIDKRKININEENISDLKDTFNLIIEYNKEQRKKKKENNYHPTRWSYAYNQYVNACTSMSIEISILNIITGLEALLVEGQGELTYRVSLYSSIIAANKAEERKNIRDLVKWMYNLRSKVVHGEVKEVVKKLSSDELYVKYYDLKELFSKIMMKIYKIDEKVVFKKIDDMIFNCPQFIK